MIWDSNDSSSALDKVGLNDPGIFTFSQDKIGSFVREMLQNSIDAKASDSDAVEIMTSYASLSKSAFPDFERWRQILLAVEAATITQPIAKNFFERIRRDLSQGSFRVLTWCDYGTVGLSDKNGDGTFWSLVRQTGISNKSSNSAIGSFGIGKNAAFGASEARTIFFASRSEDGECLFQGVSQLASYVDLKSRKPKDHRVYFGEEKADIPPIRSLDGLSEELQDLINRKRPGLSQVVVLPFKTSSWANEIAREVLRSFWPSLLNRTVKITVLDSIKDDRYILGDSEQEISEQIRAHFDGERFSSSNPLPFLKAYQLGERYSTTIEHLGPVELKLRVHDDNESSLGICYVRHGMVITTHKKDAHGFGGLKYCGVFRCLDEDGNLFLKEMEPPQHNKFCAGTYEERKGNKRVAETVLRDIKNWIQECLSLYQEAEDEKSERIDFLDQLFGGLETSAREDVKEAEGLESKLKFNSVSIDLSGASRPITLGSSSNGEDFGESGGGMSGTGAGNKIRGVKNRNKGKNQRGAGPYGGGKSRKEKVDYRMFKSGQQDKRSLYRLKVKSDFAVNEGSSIKIEQRGDSGLVNDFQLFRVRDISANVDLKWTSLENGAAIVHGVKGGNQIEISLEEPFPNQYEITGM